MIERRKVAAFAAATVVAATVGLTSLISRGPAAGEVSVSATSAASTPGPLSDSDVALVQRVAGEQMSKAGIVKVAKVSAKAVLSAYMPGEQPWGDATTQILSDDILAVEIGGAYLRQGPRPGPSPAGKESPTLGLIIFIDTRLQDSVGGLGTTQQGSMDKATLARLKSTDPTTVVVDVSVPVAAVRP